MSVDCWRDTWTLFLFMPPTHDICQVYSVIYNRQLIPDSDAGLLQLLCGGAGW